MVTMLAAGRYASCVRACYFGGSARASSARGDELYTRRMRTSPNAQSCSGSRLQAPCSAHAAGGKPFLFRRATTPFSDEEWPDPFWEMSHGSRWDDPEAICIVELSTIFLGERSGLNLIHR